MSDLLKHLDSIGGSYGIAVGIVLSVIGNYAFRFLESGRARTWMWWRHKTEASQIKFTNLIESMLDNPREEMRLSFEEQRLRLHAAMQILFTILLVLINTAGLPYSASHGSIYWLGTFVIILLLPVLALVNLIRATDKQAALRHLRAFERERKAKLTESAPRAAS
jgi:hypothetical protein